MQPLITVNEFIALRSISKKVNEEKIEESIILAQSSDLQEILGDFFFDVLNNATELTYADLMNGSTFNYCGESFRHEGLKAVLADFVYARYIYNINVNLTPFGAQTKFTNDSQAVDRNTTRDLSKQAQVDAGIKFRTVEKYLLSNPVLFERFCRHRKGGGSFNSVRISKV